MMTVVIYMRHHLADVISSDFKQSMKSVKLTSCWNGGDVNSQAPRSPCFSWIANLHGAWLPPASVFDKNTCRKTAQICIGFPKTRTYFIVVIRT